jgi:hypothetical protein
MPGLPTSVSERFGTMSVTVLGTVPTGALAIEAAQRAGGGRFLGVDW